MRCLIDGDVILYEIGFAATAAWKHANPQADKEWLSNNPPPWEIVREQLDKRILHIEQTCEATEPSIFFFTGPNNFRMEIAKRKPYKERKNAKPFHYYNIKESIKARYECYEEAGLEADDLMAIYQTGRIAERDTIICTRDKDLRQVAGWHFGWELNEQPQFGPFFVDGYGHIEIDEKRKLRGWGNKFFLAQCIMGDNVDTVEGLRKGVGPVTALEIVGPTTTYAEGLQAVLAAYRGVYEERAFEELWEQGRLLWMIRRKLDGIPEQWGFEYEE